jgi:ComEC/Rec2-related protein
VAALLAGLVYAGLAGFALPTQRALVMLAVIMAGVILRRRVAPSTSLCLALGAVLILDPFAVLSAGFWLSFGAVAVILLGMTGRIRSTRRARWQHLWWRWGRVQWLVAVGLLPVTIALFLEYPLITPLANLVAVPWTGFVLVPLVLTAVVAVAFVVFAALVGTRVIRQYSIHLERLKIRNAPFLVAMIVMLGLSALAGIIGLAAIIGAFLAGMMLAEAKERFNLEQQALPVYEFLVPFFFVIIGTKVDPGALTDPTVLAVALGVTALAVVGKLMGGGLASLGLPGRSAAIIGTGMVPRGEVGLVVASIGEGIGVISPGIFSAVVFMSIATTVIAPPLLVWLYRGYRFTAEDVAERPEEPPLPDL